VNQTGELRRQIEDMALQLVVGEPENSARSSAWMPVLEKISATAAREHVESVVRAVAGLGQHSSAASSNFRVSNSRHASKPAMAPKPWPY
jgi:hypothetical protein